jgi:hypothetical protein
MYCISQGRYFDGAVENKVGAEELRIGTARTGEPGTSAARFSVLPYTGTKHICPTEAKSCTVNLMLEKQISLA